MVYREGTMTNGEALECGVLPEWARDLSLKANWRGLDDVDLLARRARCVLKGEHEAEKSFQPRLAALGVRFCWGCRIHELNGMPGEVVR